MHKYLALAGATLLTALSGAACTPAMAATGTGTGTGAANGTLIVNGVPHTDPHGCYPATGFMANGASVYID
ncbi:hypothetical protein ACFY71_03365 [Streptomyces cinerochromogenes]|uniref:hypothetical protein n=1 Tax=Streptomyces cinerochromogenes TaxID=66422 RepID=UPI0036787E39